MTNYWTPPAGTILYSQEDGSQEPVFGLAATENGRTQALTGRGVWRMLDSELYLLSPELATLFDS